MSGKRKCFSIEEKVESIKRRENNVRTKRDVAKNFGVPSSTFIKILTDGEKNS